MQIPSNKVLRFLVKMFEILVNMFLNQDEVDGLTEPTNYIQSNKLQSHKRRPSQQTVLLRKSSVAMYSEYTFKEHFELTDAQRMKLENRENGIWATIKNGVNAMDGKLFYDRGTKSLHLMLKRADCKHEAIRIFEEQLGPLKKVCLDAVNSYLVVTH